MMITIALVVITVFGFYLYGTINYKYWERKGVKNDKPLPFLGNNARNYFMQKSFTELLAETYEKYPKEKVVGYYRAASPILIIRDPEITKRILISDFDHFYKRGIAGTKHKIEPLQKNLFVLDGDMWRLVRQSITPAFTSGKLKAMFPLILGRAEQLQARALAAASTGKEIDARDLMARYAMDIIGACGFGLDINSLQNENSPFRILGAKIINIGPKIVFFSLIKEFFPNMFKHIKTTARVEKEMFQIVNEVQRQRNYEPSGRNDFIDLLLALKKKGIILGESIEKIKPDGKPETVTLEFDDELKAAQVFAFFAAGFETSSSATSITLHELAYHPEVQNKVQEEIDRVLAKYDNKLSYDAIKEMTYLEWTLKEGLRIFPTLGFLMRECARKYTFEELDLTIDKGVRVFIPLRAMHNDPQYFDNPTEFRPERFDSENFDINKKYVYMPFGDGPRVCIGERMALMQSIVGLVAVLSCFRVLPGPSTRRHPSVNPISVGPQTIRGGLPLIFIQRKPKDV